MRKFILLAAAAVLTMSVSLDARAEDAAVKKASYVAVVDNLELMNESTAAKALNDEFKKSRDVIQTIIEKKEKEQLHCDSVEHQL